MRLTSSSCAWLLATDVTNVMPRRGTYSCLDRSIESTVFSTGKNGPNLGLQSICYSGGASYHI